MKRYQRPALTALAVLAICVIAGAGCSDDKGKTTTPGSDPPVLASIRPDTVVAGTTAHVRGEKFGATRGSSQLYFGGQSAQSLTWSETKILAVVPDGATTGELSLVVDGETSNKIPYEAGNLPPEIERIEPTESETGGTIRFEGRLFGVSKKDSKVYFGAAEATTVSWADTVIQAVVPEDAQTGNVTVVARDLESDPVPFTLLAPVDPIIDAVIPDSAFVGAGVVISGRNFTTLGAGGQVRIGGAPAAISSWSDTEIEASVGDLAAPGIGVVTVTINDRTSNGFPFKVLQAAEPVVITRLEPPRTTVGDIITIWGTGFRSETLDPIVTFQGAQGRIPTTVTVWSETSIRVWVPQGAVDGPVVVQFGEEISEGFFFSVAPRRITFTNDVRPLFEEKGCLGCHSGSFPSANLNLETKAQLLTSDSDHTPVVIVRNAAESILVQKVGPEPPFGDRMPLGCTTNCMVDEEILILSDWVDQGTDN